MSNERAPADREAAEDEEKPDDHEPRRVVAAPVHDGRDTERGQNERDGKRLHGIPFRVRREVQRVARAKGTFACGSRAAGGR
ncbi:hypothetical protein Asi02nite_14030 [Asanoa siamensis]|uniref:Uncharacterized protein n=1 Tax=Asanoa siamensis TaxID=926357 RepID=A0ABQ4CKS2_9ACTN|nr:hypothetical protein Asi02nite_14030 [Asanoa siamensis]